ncbi:MAG: hypothetical protein HJJLKODD_01717 [Phycisphaerae bacterium]|nr:hypothetical protein [Phycisphaerae bacterium]
MLKRSYRSTGMILAVLLMGSAGCQINNTEGAALNQRDGILLHISHGHDNPHAVCMALKMATLMSAHRDVLVYFDLQGVEAVDRHGEEITHPAFDSARQQLQKPIDAHVPLYVCPSCLKAAGKTMDDVVKGVQVANKEAFFTFTRGRIVTLDY